MYKHITHRPAFPALLGQGTVKRALRALIQSARRLHQYRDTHRKMLHATLGRLDCDRPQPQCADE